MKKITSIYAKIPSVKGCKRGCTDCCGPVPFTEEEWLMIPRKLRMLKEVPGECRFKDEHGCMIYPARPLICRMFGAVDQHMLKCPHGARSETLLSSRAAQCLIQSAGAPYCYS